MATVLHGSSYFRDKSSLFQSQYIICWVQFWCGCTKEINWFWRRDCKFKFELGPANGPATFCFVIREASCLTAICSWNVSLIIFEHFFLWTFCLADTVGKAKHPEKFGQGLSFLIFCEIYQRCSFSSLCARNAFSRVLQFYWKCVDI